MSIVSHNSIRGAEGAKRRTESMGRAKSRDREALGLYINVFVANFAIAISIDRHICSHSPLIALRYAYHAYPCLYKRAPLLTVRAQCTTATCRSSVSARTRLAAARNSQGDISHVHAPDLPSRVASRRVTSRRVASRRWRRGCKGVRPLHFQ